MKHLIKLEIYPLESDGIHLFIRARINGKAARFLVDTGASRTVVDQTRILGFFDEGKAEFEHLDSKSTGLGTNSMESKTILLRTLSFGRLKLNDYQTAALDLTHVNQSYSLLRMKEIDGVIGGDLLYRLQAVIDYGDQVLRLK
jgi:predicted aspartyl protease